MPLAVNEQTGETLMFDGQQWVKAPIAENPKTGERMAFDGEKWSPLGNQEKPSLGDRVLDIGTKTAKGAYDYANQFRTGLAEGVAGLAALPRTVFDMTAAANRYLGGKAESALGVEPGTLVDPMQKYGAMVNPLSYLPNYEQTSSGIKNTVEAIPGVPKFAGPPANIPQKLVRYTGEAFGAAPIPGAIGPNLGVGVGGTLGEEIAKATGFSPSLGKTVGGMGGAFIGSVPGMVRSTPAEMIARRTENMTPAEWQAAQARQAQANAQGLPIMGPEATDNPALHRLASDVAASSGGGERTEQFLRGRVPAARNAVERNLNTLGPAQIPEDVARRVQEAATRAIQDAAAARTQAAQPFYQAAAGDRLPQQSLDYLANTLDTLSQNTPEQIARQLQGLRQRILANPTIGAVSGEVKLLREATRPDAINVPLVDRMVASRATPFVRTAEAEMETQSANYNAGQRTYRNMSPAVNRLEQGDIGRLASPRPEEVAKVGSKLAQQWEVVANPDTARPGTIRALANDLANTNGGADAFRDLARTHLENVFNKAFKRIQSGENRMAPVNFHNAVAGTGQDAQNLRTILEESARLSGQNPNGVWAGWRNMLETFERMGKIPGIGSPTTGRMESFAEAAQGGAVNTVLNAAKLTDPLAVVRRWWQDTVQRGNMAELADIFTRPDSVQIMREMAMVRPGTARANALAVQLVTAGRGAEQLNQ